MPCELCDITLGRSLDENQDGVPDECECTGPADGDGDGDADLRDVAAFAGRFAPGTEAPAPCACAFDTDGNELIDLADFATLNAMLTGPLP